MPETTQQYLATQLALFDGGYDQVMVEFTVHFSAREDRVQMGTLLKDTVTREWIACEVRDVQRSLATAEHLASSMIDTITMVRNLIDPF